jgi:hypothetical protein
LLCDELTIRLDQNSRDQGVVVVVNHDAGLTMLFAVGISLDDIELIQLPDGSTEA